MINRALKLLRTYHQLTQVELASRLEISNSYLSEIEKGVKSPSIDLLNKYSNIFNMPVSTILLFSENIDDKKSITKNKIRVSAADKLLKILEWLADYDSIAPKSV
jgi:transcriptional regulator with XRE-family HTH domain